MSVDEASKQDEKSEVRRFVVPQDCSTSMVYLKEKLRSIFGRQLENGMKITWRDEDDDDVCIETDEELVIALHEMKGPLYKLAVVACHQEPLKNADSKTDHVHETPVGAEAHPGVVCDACDGPVVGHRYKCLKCPDYDLCGKCEAKGFHPGHNMMRIATPETIWPRHFFNRLNKMQTRAAKINEAKSEASKNSENNENEEQNSDNAGGASGWGRGRGRFKGQRRGCQRGSGSVPPFWMPPTAGGNPWGDLMNIGQAVREALDPFGVDVDIEVETPEGKQKVEKAKEARENKTSEANESSKPKQDETKATDTTETLNEASKSVEKTEEAKAEARNDATVTEVAKSLEKMDVQKEPEVIETPKKPEESAKDAGIDDWTVLDNASTASPSPNKSKSASPEPEFQGPKPKTPRLEPETRGAEAIQGPLYPKLDRTPDLSGLSPKIKIALEAMENMGFTNEGGWLSNLLVKYDGDIGKVLDLLAPARA